MEENVITIKPFMEKKIVLHKYPLLKESIVAFQFERLENEIRGKEKQIATADTKVITKSGFDNAAVFIDCVEMNCNSLFTSCVSSRRSLT